MGNAFQKASPVAGNKHAILNNSQASEATGGDRSLLNVTDDNVASTMLVNDPRSPTDGINRTPIQINRSKSLFRNMFAGRRPSQPEIAASNAAVVDDCTSPGSNSEAKSIADVVCVTSNDTAPSPKISTSTPLSDGNKTTKDSDLLINPDDGKTIANSADDAKTAENDDDAFIVVDKNAKKKKKKQEKAEAKARVEADIKSQDEEEEEEEEEDCLNVSGKPILSKRHSASNVDVTEADPSSKASDQNNENENPSSLRVKVEKACRSLTNLSSKGKLITVNNGQVKNSGSPKLGAGDNVEPTTGSSAPVMTSPLAAEVCSEREEPNAASGKYALLVNLNDE